MCTCRQDYTYFEWGDLAHSIRIYYHTLDAMDCTQLRVGSLADLNTKEASMRMRGGMGGGCHQDGGCAVKHARRGLTVQDLFRHVRVRVRVRMRQAEAVWIRPDEFDQHKFRYHIKQVTHGIQMCVCLCL